MRALLSADQQPRFDEICTGRTAAARAEEEKESVVRTDYGLLTSYAELSGNVECSRSVNRSSERSCKLLRYAQCSHRSDQTQQHIFLSIPDVSLGAEKRVAGAARSEGHSKLYQLVTCAYR